jgi:hypothetical protein
MKMGNDSTRNRMCHGSAVALLVAVSLVSASPVWHQGHHSMALSVAKDAGHEHDIHVCSTGGHATPAVNCPICLSQRLLDQGDIEASAQPVAPTSATAPRSAWHLPTRINISFDEQARAPPSV